MAGSLFQKKRKKGFGWQGGDKSRKIPRHIAAELELVLTAWDVREFRLQTSSGVIFVYENRQVLSADAER